MAFSLCTAGQLNEAEELLSEFIAYAVDRADSDKDPWRSRLQNAKQELTMMKMQEKIPGEETKSGS